MQAQTISQADYQILSQAGFGVPKKVSTLASGANNEIFIVEFETRKLAFKKTLESGVARLGNEAVILSLLQGRSVPRIFWAGTEPQGNNPRALLMEYLEGSHPFALDEQTAFSLGMALKQIHGVDIHEYRNRLESPKWDEYYRNRLLSQLSFAKKTAPDALCKAMDLLLQRIKALGEGLGPLWDEKDKVLIHSDLIPLNVIFSDGICKLIDWELGRMDYPEWDLCSVDKAFRFTIESRKQFYEAYQKEIDLDRYKLISLMHHSNVALWRMCSFYGRGENQQIKEKFLGELDQEIQWIQQNIP